MVQKHELTESVQGGAGFVGKTRIVSFAWADVWRHASWRATTYLGTIGEPLLRFRFPASKASQLRAVRYSNYAFYLIQNFRRCGRYYSQCII